MIHTVPDKKSERYTGLALKRVKFRANSQLFEQSSSGVWPLMKTPWLNSGVAKINKFRTREDYLSNRAFVNGNIKRSAARDVYDAKLFFQ